MKVDAFNTLYSKEGSLAPEKAPLGFSALLAGVQVLWPFQKAVWPHGP